MPHFNRKQQAKPVRLCILRRKNADSEPHWQTVDLGIPAEDETVASALTRINEGGFTDETGSPVSPIRWECSCLQKKCGACAMVINGRPRLACDTFLREFRKSDVITLEPLKKFPVIADLVVDRSILMNNLRTMELWSEETTSLKERERDTAYDASRCLQCGCCLEVCPNFAPDGRFFGAAGFVPTARLLTSCTGEELQRLRSSYREHAYSGCGKSLACENICPAEIGIGRLLLHSNAASLWRKHEK